MPKHSVLHVAVKIEQKHQKPPASLALTWGLGHEHGAIVEKHFYVLRTFFSGKDTNFCPL